LKALLKNKPLVLVYWVIYILGVIIVTKFDNIEDFINSLIIDLMAGALLVIATYIMASNKKSIKKAV
jgi:hypothetical protein